MEPLLGQRSSCDSGEDLELELPDEKSINKPSTSSVARQWLLYFHYILDSPTFVLSRNNLHKYILLAIVWIIRLPLFLIPSFASQSPEQEHKITPTSWLDGLRGIACFIVFIYHYGYAYFPSQRNAYDGEANHYFFQLPVIRIVHSGSAMVAIFYVISGFALSYKTVNLLRKPISSLQSGSSPGQLIVVNLASSIWKRWLRLVLPCFGTFMLVSLVVAGGGFETIPFGQKGLLPRHVEPRPPKLNGLYEQLVWGLKDYYKFAVRITLLNKVDEWGAGDTDTHLWTIPVEFQRSLFLFVIMAALAHLKRWTRVAVFLPAIASIALYNGFWENSLFIYGFFLAEIHSTITNRMNEDMSSLPFYSPKRQLSTVLPLLRSFIAGLFFCAGLAIASYPDDHPRPEASIGYNYLLAWTSPNCDRGRFWMVIGAMMLVSSVMFLSSIQWILCTRPLQYLGRISFSLYLTHGVMNRSLGYTLVQWGWRQVGITVPGMVLSEHLDNMRILIVVLVFFVNAGATICVADVFWRGIDLPSVKFARWLEGRFVRSL
ncbi:hypothetical protein TWF694_006396 [Orbilia ellipsospora]|uniref:Acyltransferase 3 domain-containing protein n=1 Tax=Orbilia ellipsospora TaxID=2528407 RepID=A0AAV9XKE1_9PEZI